MLILVQKWAQIKQRASEWSESKDQHIRTSMEDNTGGGFIRSDQRKRQEKHEMIKQGVLEWGKLTLSEPTEGTCTCSMDL